MERTGVTSLLVVVGRAVVGVVLIVAAKDATAVNEVMGTFLATLFGVLAIVVDSRFLNVDLVALEALGDCFNGGVMVVASVFVDYVRVLEGVESPVAPSFVYYYHDKNFTFYSELQRGAKKKIASTTRCQHTVCSELQHLPATNTIYNACRFIKSFSQILVSTCVYQECKCRAVNRCKVCFCFLYKSRRFVLSQ